MSEIGFTPKISVITVVFNAKSTIEATLISAIEQDYTNVEFVVIDGVSTDGTLDVLNNYKDKIDILISEPDSGIYDAMNKGLQAATGDYAIFLGSDDVFIGANVLTRIAAHLKRDNNVYYGNAIFKSNNKLYDVEPGKWFLSLRNFSHQTIFYPKSLYKAKSYNVKYRLFADHIYNLEIFAAGQNKFVHLPVTTVLYNDGGSSSQANDPDYFKDLPTIVGRLLGLKYGVYVYLRLTFFKFKKSLKLKS